MVLPSLNPNRSKQDDTDPEKNAKKSFGLLNWLSLGLLTFGIFIVLLFGASSSGKSTIFLWMLACLLSGTAIGFLFGIPKILQNNSGNAADKTVALPVYQQQVNTNLTEISDWLTKIIVGLGLVNLTKLPPYLRSIATILAKGLSGADKEPSSLSFAFAYGTIISYAVLGFLFGYITTRLYLAAAFSKADKDALDLTNRQIKDLQGATDSANQKAEFARVKPIEIGKNENLPNDKKLEELAKLYVTTRTAMDPGHQRTSKMTEIFKSMVEVASATEGFSISQNLAESDIGKRLSGYAYLYAKPDLTYLSELIRAFTTDPTPFGQYWGIQTLGNILIAFPQSKIGDEDMNKLKTYYNSLKKGIDREYELKKLLPEVTK